MANKSNLSGAREPGRPFLRSSLAALLCVAAALALAGCMESQRDRARSHCADGFATSSEVEACKWGIDSAFSILNQGLGKDSGAGTDWDAAVVDLAEKRIRHLCYTSFDSYAERFACRDGASLFVLLAENSASATEREYALLTAPAKAPAEAAIATDAKGDLPSIPAAGTRESGPAEASAAI